METLLLKDSQPHLLQAAKIIKNGGIVAVPTETVYGLAADALNGKAVAKIFAAKGRPMDNPLIVHVSNIEMIENFGLYREFTAKARLLAEKFWPGPLTIILPKGSVIPDEVSAGLDTVAVRCPSHPVARELIQLSHTPLAAPSANLSGKPSPTKFQHCVNDLMGRADAIIDGGESSVGVESTVITLAENPPRLLRPGGITVEQIEEVIGKIEIDSAVLNRLEDGRKAASPGMKYKHYAPKAQVYLVKGKGFVPFVNKVIDSTSAAICFDENRDSIKGKTYSIGKENDYSLHAHRIFDVLREIDRDNTIKKVFAPLPKKTGISLAVYNRLIRAAAFRIINADAFVLGLTGPTGSGKTTVALTFAQMGYHIVDTDKIAKKIMEKGGEALPLTAKEFGKDIIKEDGTLDRKLLAQRAFKDRESTQRLNKITHPLIYEKSLLEIQEYSEKGYDKFILDAPVLFESNGERFCTKTLAVTAPKEIRINRIMSRDGITREDALLRMNAQHTDDFYTSHADFTLINDGEKEDLQAKTIRLIEEYL